MAEQFASRQHDFQDLAAAYRLHAASFQTVGGSVGRVAHLIAVNQRFDAESQSAAELQAELGHIDDVLAKTFDSLPDDLTPIFNSPAGPAPKPAAGGIWNRLLRMLGLEHGSEPKSTITVTENP
jgi:hypothetical protein